MAWCFVPGTDCPSAQAAEALIWASCSRIGGTMALIAAITRKAFTNEALLDRLDRELIADRDRIDRQRSEDRKADGDRLDRIETDIRSMRDMLFDAFQRGRSD